MIINHRSKKMDEKQKHTCSDCEFFIQHYTKTSYKFSKTIIGHCVLKLSLRNIGVMLYYSDICSKWKERKAENVQVDEKLKYILINMSKQINEIAELLRNEE